MITPFGDQILVQPVETKQLLLSDQKSLCEYGKVIAVGKDVKNVQVNDVIGFLVWGMNSLEIEGTKYYFIQETPDFILGKIDASALPPQQ